MRGWITIDKCHKWTRKGCTFRERYAADPGLMRGEGMEMEGKGKQEKEGGEREFRKEMGEGPGGVYHSCHHCWRLQSVVHL